MTVTTELFNGFIVSPDDDPQLQHGICPECGETDLVYRSIAPPQEIEYHGTVDRRRPGECMCRPCGYSWKHDFLATDVRFRIRIHK